MGGWASSAGVCDGKGWVACTFISWRLLLRVALLSARAVTHFAARRRPPSDDVVASCPDRPAVQWKQKGSTTLPRRCAHHSRTEADRAVWAKRTAVGLGVSRALADIVDESISHQGKTLRKTFQSTRLGSGSGSTVSWREPSEAVSVSRGRSRQRCGGAAARIAPRAGATQRPAIRVDAPGRASTASRRSQRRSLLCRVPNARWGACSRSEAGGCSEVVPGRFRHRGSNRASWASSRLNRG